MDTESWPQDGGMMPPVEEKINPNNYVVSSSKAAMEKRSARPPQSKEQALNCPRCSSTNTKFCYYNNYSLSQPRYFCKNCRRYWTEGGSIRNVPVGGGSRKNKRSITIASSAGAAITATTASTQAFLRIPDLSPQSLSLLPPPHHDPNPRSHGGVHGGTPHDLGLNTYLGLSQFVHPHGPRPDQTHIAASAAAPSHHRSAAPPTATELFRTGMASRGLNSFMQGPAPEADAGLSFPAEFKGFPPVEGFGVGRGGQHGFQENSNERLLFPFGELGQISSSSGSGVDQSNKGQESSGGWWNMNNGVLGGGSW